MTAATRLLATPALRWQTTTVNVSRSGVVLRENSGCDSLLAAFTLSPHVCANESDLSFYVPRVLYPVAFPPQPWFDLADPPFHVTHGGHFLRHHFLRRVHLEEID